LKRTISLHNTHATQRNKAAYHNYTVNVAYQFHFAGTKYMIKTHELSMIMMSAAHTVKITLIFV